MFRRIEPANTLIHMIDTELSVIKQRRITEGVMGRIVMSSRYYVTRSEI